MREFRLCAACEAEYRDPANRRFHAEPSRAPIAARVSPTAAPTPARRSRKASSLPRNSPAAPAAHREAALQAALADLRAGRIVAIKGLGGYHLACDATDPAAVARLRDRKHRWAKPFAVMVRDLAAARVQAEMSAEEEKLLVFIGAADRAGGASPPRCDGRATERGNATRRRRRDGPSGEGRRPEPPCRDLAAVHAVAPPAARRVRAADRAYERQSLRRPLATDDAEATGAAGRDRRLVPVARPRDPGPLRRLGDAGRGRAREPHPPRPWLRAGAVGPADRDAQPFWQWARN